jgi:CubicO group peptidase (beta-lactamase class C family)
VGHLGFTGTSFWIDPVKDVAIVLLSNRVHPSRENIKIKQFRPYCHDRIMEKLFPLLK